MKHSGHKLSMSPSVSPPTVAFGQFGYATPLTHQNTSGAASPTTPSSVSGSSCCEPLTLRLSAGVSGGQHGLIPNSASTIHPNPNSVTPLSMDAISSNRFNATTGGLANVSHHHNSPTTPSAFYATKPSAYPDPSYCNPAVIDPSTVSFYQTLPTYAASWAHGIAAQSAAAAYYDPAFTQYGYSPGYDFNGSARRKNVTRDSTTTLKAWLNEHRKNPYPTKGEKIMLAIITKMTLTQVSTWFANARRRLKKENKMTWEPRNRCDDNEDDIITSDDENDNKPENMSESDQTSNMSQMTGSKDLQANTEYVDSLKDLSESSRGHSIQTSANCVIIPSLTSAVTTCSSTNETLQHSFTDKCNPTNSASKPKIWSLAETAIDDKPKSPLSHHNHHNPNLNPNVNLSPALHLSAHNIHSNAFSASTPTNMSGWYHPSAHSHTTPYTSVNPYGAHYMPSLQRHFQHTSAATSLPPQADTPPESAMKLASESGAMSAITLEQVNCVHSPKIIAYRNQGEQIGQSGNTSPPTQIYGSEFRITSDNLSETSHSFNNISSAVHHQTQDSNNNSNNNNNNK